MDRIANKVYIMDTVTSLYREKHKMTVEDFLKLNSKVDILGYICDCTWVFDGLPNEKMIEIVEELVNGNKKVQN